jgi:glycosyltransferase involved in cell wall biosynthesis
MTFRIALVSTYPPRPCGIGTFSRDLRAALLQADPTIDVDVVSIVRDHHQPAAPEVLSVIRQDAKGDYLAVPALLDGRGTDVVLVEHEYGIFGGEAGSHVLSLVRELRQPFVVTLHTVLSEPSEQQAAVLGELCHRAALVTVFTETARRMILDAGLAPSGRVQVVPHGAPTVLRPKVAPDAEPGPTASDHRTAADTELAARDIDRGTGPSGADSAAISPTTRRTMAHLEGRTVLSTFGLISAGKGIEMAIEALSEVVPVHPEVLYLVAGQTHPEVVKSQGERYRLSLERLVRDRGLEANVHFLDRFLDIEELAYLLAGTDLYLTPYRSREQIVSGALTFAVAAGCPVVSTPYFYAEDLLASGAGVLVPFDDSKAFAKAILQLLDTPGELAAAAAEARRVGAELSWPAVGAVTVEVLRHAQGLGIPAEGGVAAGRVASSPSIRSDHLLTLVDDVGIVQHADGVIPNRASGYCVDDMARLVIVALGLDRDADDRTFKSMVTMGLSFLRYAWSPDGGGMHNMMSYDRHWLDEPHDGDHLGRTVWALGAVVAAHPPRAVAAPSLRLLEEMADTVERTTSMRTTAFAILGLSRPPIGALTPRLRALLETLTARLAGQYRSFRTPEWRWFEPTLTYDNARLTQALIAGGHRLGDPQVIADGVEALEWYGEQCEVDGPAVRLVGNAWRRSKGSPGAGDDGDEQPLDATALVEALTDAVVATGQRRYGGRAVRAFEWFLGRNRLGEPVYDFATGGCHDGLSGRSLNDNEGAESTLAFFQALLALEAAGLQSSLPQP